VRDVTARHEAEAEGSGLGAGVIGAAVVREREERLRAEVERLRHLQATVGEAAHDLKNLLGVVLSCAEFAIEAVPDLSELRTDLMEIMHAAERATAVAAALELSATVAASLDPVVTPATHDVGVPAGRPGGSILVVERQEVVRRLTTRILSDSGYEILAAANFEAAATLWEAHRASIDLLLTDVDLGERSGLDLADVVWRTAPDLPVLFLRGDPGHEALAGGGDRRTGVVEKPLGSDSLLRSVGALLEGRF
jgi:CheY-like chemotaxis protein